jgi:hypothetical protein
VKEDREVNAVAKVKKEIVDPEVLAAKKEIEAKWGQEVKKEILVLSDQGDRWVLKGYKVSKAKQEKTVNKVAVVYKGHRVQLDLKVMLDLPDLRVNKDQKGTKVQWAGRAQLALEDLKELKDHKVRRDQLEHKGA